MLIKEYLKIEEEGTISPKIEVFSVCTPKGVSLVEAFFETLMGTQNERAMAKFDFIIKLAKEKGLFELTDNLSHIMDQKEKIYQFIAGNIRIPYFKDEENGHIIICSHGFLKKSQKAPKREKEKALSFKSQYLKAKKSGSLKKITE